MEKMHSNELAERYVLGNMSPEEKKAFEQEMLLKPELKKEVDMLNGISYAIQDEDLLEFRAMVQEESAEYRVSRKSQRLRKMLVRASAAAASIIMIAATFFVLSIQGHKPVSSAKVFSNFYTPYPSNFASRTGSESIDELYSSAIRDYAAMQFKSAATIFDGILNKDPNHNGALFFSGLSHMEIKEYEKAGKQFARIILNDNSLYVQQAEWYLGLSLLAVNDRKSALVHFRKLASKKGYYKANARQVLDELKDNK